MNPLSHAERSVGLKDVSSATTPKTIRDEERALRSVQCFRFDGSFTVGSPMMPPIIKVARPCAGLSGLFPCKTVIWFSS